MRLWKAYAGKMFMINRNMGCIEITTSKTDELKARRLIETWDVLK